MKEFFDHVENFDDHIRKSIPSYDVLYNLFSDLTYIYSRDYSTIIDIGCSTGKFLLELQHRKGCDYIGIDNSNLIPRTIQLDSPVEFRKQDVLNVCEQFVDNNYNISVVVSMFFLQFLDSEFRCQMIEYLKTMVDDGATLLIAEKVYFDDVKVDNIISSLHLKEKRKTFTDVEILDKDYLMTKSMRCVTDDELFNELSQIGHPTKVWQSYNFVGYVVTK